MKESTSADILRDLASIYRGMLIALLKAEMHCTKCGHTHHLKEIDLGSGYKPVSEILGALGES